MVFSDNEIRQMCKSSKPLISPFTEESLQSESYDVAIGDKITIMKKEIHCIDLQDQRGINEIYEEITLNESGYLISPNEYIMVSLRETITLPDNVTAHVRPRTRLTRLGLLTGGQHCNSTYSGTLRIGLFNATKYPIRIQKGVKVAQIVFEELKSIPSEEKQYKNKKTARFQNEGAEFIGSKFDDEVESVTDDIIRKIFE